VWQRIRHFGGLILRKKERRGALTASRPKWSKGWILTIDRENMWHSICNSGYGILWEKRIWSIQNSRTPKSRSKYQSLAVKGVWTVDLVHVCSRVRSSSGNWRCERKPKARSSKHPLSWRLGTSPRSYEGKDLERGASTCYSNSSKRPGEPGVDKTYTLKERGPV
jgi:hypothetical protein